MPRKIFLSFLGTNAYVPCNYYWEHQPESRVDNVQYIQEALLRMHPFGEGDTCYFFLTELAHKTNWQSDGLFNPATKKYDGQNDGLLKRLSLMKQDGVLAANLVPVSIPDGFTSEEVWTIFDRIFSRLQNGDQLVLDVTHAFRSLPMLAMVLISYAKAIKQVEVEAIYYGAFEKLGLAAQVRNMPLEERNAPVLDLKSFSELQNWTTAAHDFVHYGNPSLWNKLAKKETGGLLTKVSEQHQLNVILRRIGAKMEYLSQNIATNRGGHLLNFPFSELQDDLDAFMKNASDSLLPVNAIIEQVQDKIRPFEQGSRLIWLEAVHWCIKHQLIPQGFSQLQEGLLTFLCQYYDSRGIMAGFFNWQKVEPRNFINALLNILDSGKKENEWTGIVAKHSSLALTVMHDPMLKNLSKPYSSLTKSRNDIMHGGYTKTKKACLFYAELNTYYEQIRKEVEAHAGDTLAPPYGLLNLSNHPVDRWPDRQRQVAIQQFSDIQDLPFPAIDPLLTPSELEMLVHEYFERVVALNPAAVHLMGEMTFTFALVQRLKAIGIPCVASTTERIAEERDGQKVVTFRFVQFRAY
ncbi:MAG: TIGR02221 family CRISPR-associated protein [Saprospiraceae bacterium]